MNFKRQPNLNKVFLLCLVLLLGGSNLRAQITIGANVAPNAGSLLDLKQSEEKGWNAKRGLALPRVELKKLGSLDPCIKDEDLEQGDKGSHAGLVVYNVSDIPLERLCEGLYVWDSQNWQRVSTPCPRYVNPDYIYTPNCYIVSPNSGVSEDIPIGKAFLVWGKYDELGEIPQDIKITVDLLWQDTPNLIKKVELADPTIIDGEKKIRVTLSNATATGNALVAVRMGSQGNNTDPIRWSWHVWVTDYDPNAASGALTHNNGEAQYDFMDRNLGATSDRNLDAKGLLYQWGRKDPFTGPDHLQYPLYKMLYTLDNTQLSEVNELQNSSVGTGIQHKEVTVNNSLINSVENPLSFYYGKFESGSSPIDEESAFDWFTSDETGASGKDDLWGLAGVKSEFDPCPKGWKVPSHSATKSPWAQFETGGGWGGWGRAAASAFDDYEVQLIGGAGVTRLGYYPYVLYRFPRAFKGFGNVGSDANVAGGMFSDNVDLDNPVALYWTTDAVAGKTTAKLEYFNKSFFANTIASKNISRALGASVRCVKENN